MACAEEIFAVDSGTASDLIMLARSGQSSLDRTTLAVLSVDGLLSELGLDVGGRLASTRTR